MPLGNKSGLERINLGKYRFYKALSVSVHFRTLMYTTTAKVLPHTSVSFKIPINEMKLTAIFLLCTFCYKRLLTYYNKWDTLKYVTVNIGDSFKKMQFLIAHHFFYCAIFIVHHSDQIMYKQNSNHRKAVCNWAFWKSRLVLNPDD